MSLEEMNLRDEIIREPLSSGEVSRFNESIAQRLEDANNTSNYNLTRLELAYYAILNCELLALRVDGYRVRSAPGHHIVALESLADTMGADNRDIDYFLELSKTRGRSLYDATPISDSDVFDAVEAATALAEQLSAWLDARGVEK